MDFYYNSTSWKTPVPVKHIDIEHLVYCRDAFGLLPQSGATKPESPCGWVQNFWFPRILTKEEMERLLVEPE
jgi:hypothetical protein